MISASLEGVTQAAAEAERSVIDVATLIADDRRRLLQTNAGSHAYRLFELLPMMPRFTIERVRRQLAISFPTASAAVALLQASGIVAEMTGQQKHRVFGYRRYIELLARAES